jgi:ADP-heptose:LPS heptosyltransferase
VADIIIAPFSNSAIRDWPAEHYAELVGLLLEQPRVNGRIRVIGTRNQRLGGCEVVRYHPADRVVNECGRRSWPDVQAMLQTAGCVIGNNSGIAHLAGYYSVPTVCVFGGSHQQREWRPRGRNVVVVSRAIGCSPCQLDHGSFSPYNKACLREISPRDVCNAALTVMEQADRQSQDEAR